MFSQLIHFNNNFLCLKVFLNHMKDHVQTTGIDVSLNNYSIYEHKCLENIKTLYKQAGKCDDQQQLKDIFEDVMVSTPVVSTDNSPISPMTTT